MNTKLMFSSATCEWATPLELFKALDAEFGFTCDVCATADNAKCAEFFSPEQDGLAQEWTGVCWCNPPYGREIGKWVRKAAESSCTVVMLLPARTDMPNFMKDQSAFIARILPAFALMLWMMIIAATERERTVRKGAAHDTLAMGARGVYLRRLAWHRDNGRHYRREPRR